MNKLSTSRKITRRDFIKLGGGALGAALAARLMPNPLARSGEVALAASPAAEPPPDIHFAATDGWIYLPGQVPIPGTTDQYYNPDPLAPNYTLDPTQKLTTYIFGFRNVTGLTQDQIIAQKMKAQASAPMFWVDQEQSYRLKLSNLGLQMRPDLVDSHTVHWHGFRNAYPIFDGEPHSSLAVPIGRSITMYYKPHDPGTYMYHCHFEETEHVHMGMTGTVYVRPIQNLGNPALGIPAGKYAYNDGVAPGAPGSTAYDREFVITLTDVWSEAHWDDAHIQLPDWTDFRPEYFLMNGRVYPDTIAPRGPGNDLVTGDLLPTPGYERLQYQPISSLIQANQNERVLLRIVNLTFGQQAMTLPGLKMRVVGKDATLLRGRDGTNLFYDTNTVYLGSGESVDAIITMPAVSSMTRYLFYNRAYQRNSNAGSTGYGGQMTEIRVFPSGIPAQTEPNT